MSRKKDIADLRRVYEEAEQAAVVAWRTYEEKERIRKKAARAYHEAAVE